MIIRRKSWEEFQSSGMLFAVNTFLQFFGWAIIMETDNNTKEIIDIYPARVNFRGFSDDAQELGHTKVAEYLASQAPKFPEEIK